MSGALRWSGTIKSKTEGMLEETQPDHAIRSSVAITKLPLGRDILKKKKNKQQQQKGEMLFFIWIFFLTFWLSYSTYSIVTSSRTPQINFMKKFGVTAII